MHWYLDVLKRYTDFSGRARRQEYWMFMLIHIIVLCVLYGGEAAVGGQGVLYGLYTLGTLLPTLALTARRLHDTGRTGWWMLISFVPAIGGLVLLIFTVMDSKPGDNQYGPNPKGVAA